MDGSPLLPPERTKQQEANDALLSLVDMRLYHIDKKFRDAIQSLLTFVNKPRHVVGVSVLITDGAGKVLLGRRNKNIQAGGMYSTPGGKVDLGESLEQAAIREVKEECGVNIEGLCFSNLGHKIKHRWGDHSVIFYLYVQITDKELLSKISNPEPDKCDGWEWVHLWKAQGLAKHYPETITEPEEFINALYVREVCD